jgi:4-carboxymuconolactone decarboxylase
MSSLNLRERELVALGAALAANCVPCIEFHVPAARKAGLTDAEIDEAIALADKIKQVPAGKVLEAARQMLGSAGASASAATGSSACGTVPAGKSACC